MLEEVNGIVIGPITRTGQWHYEGRPQGRRVWAETDSGLLESKARAEFTRMKADCGQAFELIYPNTQTWEFREFLD